MTVNHKRGGRTPGEVAHDRWVQVWRSHLRGHSGRSIARSMGLSHTCVQYYIRKGCPPEVHPPKTDAQVFEFKPRRSG